MLELPGLQHGTVYGAPVEVRDLQMHEALGDLSTRVGVVVESRPGGRVIVVTVYEIKG